MILARAPLRFAMASFVQRPVLKIAVAGARGCPGPAAVQLASFFPGKSGLLAWRSCPGASPTSDAGPLVSEIPTAGPWGDFSSIHGIDIDSGGPRPFVPRLTCWPALLTSGRERQRRQSSGSASSVATLGSTPTLSRDPQCRRLRARHQRFSGSIPYGRTPVHARRNARWRGARFEHPDSDAPTQQSFWESV